MAHSKRSHFSPTDHPSSAVPSLTRSSVAAAARAHFEWQMVDTDAATRQPARWDLTKPSVTLSPLGFHLDPVREEDETMEPEDTPSDNLVPLTIVAGFLVIAGGLIGPML
ncbi:hypothetical protein [Consotaella salsifontis]|uniref:Uncharacterized protein n=1 Tax=Consotaella salsifontis TaxID=1365950 RepID=A0A1T4NM63_9HYPH|nr:hypothetical protein [Consotaella salsifontis]SJZ80401.1 hypothetical protein SAMN05428963_10396 [Consotaella salsifontis]